MLPIDTVAVLGASDVGATCAVLSSLAGCTVRLFDPSDAALERAFETVRVRVELAFTAGIITRADRQRALDGLLFTPDLHEAVTGADLAVDAADAATAADGGVYGPLAEALRATAVVAAAGATLPPDVAARLPHPGRVLALRLADADLPVPRLHVLAAPATSPHVLERTRAFALRVNRAGRAPGDAR